MAWRGSTDPKDRIFGAMPYLLPLFYALPFGVFLFRQFPILTLIEIPLLPVALLFNAVPFGFGGMIIFFILYLAVVRNERISHFIRFNTMQAILIDILIILLSLIFRVLAQGMAGLLVETLYNVVFLGTLVACFYSIIQSIIGRYAEIPTISEAVYTQVR